MPILLNKTIRLFLDSIGRREEYEYYLSKFQSARTAAFAALCPVRVGFEEVAPVFTFDLDTLLRMELFPVIILCGEDAFEMCRILVREEHPYCVHTIEGDVNLSDAAEVLQVGAFVESCKKKNCTGVVVATHLRLEELLPALIPTVVRRVHMIRPGGQLRGTNGDSLSYYYTEKPDSPELDVEDRWIANWASALLLERPGTHISVASPWNLIEELFTVKGAGCVIRRGSIIEHVLDLGQLDLKRMAALLEESFKKSLKNMDFMSRIEELYLERDYRGAALLEKTDAGMYLSKFAVGVDARGAGLAQELWDSLMVGHPRLFWRARANNAINQWYEKHADGYFKTSDWCVFWRGIAAENVSDIIAYSLTRPEDFC